MKKINLLTLIILLTTATLYCKYWNQFDYSKLSKSEKLEFRERNIKNKKKIEEFNKSKGTNWKVSWHENEKHLSRAILRMEVNNLIDSLSIVTFADEIVHDFLPFIGVNRNELVLSKVNIEAHRNYYSVRYKQHVNGILFEQKGGISVSYNKGRVMISSSCFANFRINTTPSITKEQAWIKAKLDAGPDVKNPWMRPDTTNTEKIIVINDSTSITAKPYYSHKTDQYYKDKTMLTLFQKPKRTKEGKIIYNDIKLTYKVIVYYTTYYIDALNGEVIYKKSNVTGSPYFQK